MTLVQRASLLDFVVTLLIQNICWGLQCDNDNDGESTIMLRVQ